MKWFKMTLVLLALAFIVLRGVYGLILASSTPEVGETTESHV